ncbi:MAG: Asp-tRNA(Asn)/Glu-tRNA(Gln) amidotransferase subunit GatA [Lachnospirales bacterium]
MDITSLTIKDLQNKLRNKEISSLEITNSYFNNIEKEDGLIGSYLTLTKDLALEKAKFVDEKIAKNEKIANLAGIPYGMKDNICTKNVKTTCASKMLEDFIPVYNAFVTEKLEAEGAIMLGKMNMDEFAMGSSNENSAFKIVRNPKNTERVPGGSSGGSAAAVAGNLAPFTLGSDTGGSIRQPASFCGVVGMKPTYGKVSRNGLIAFASSLDQIGPITKTVEDNAIVLNTISGHDKLDSTSIKENNLVDLKALNDDIRGVNIALPKEYFGDGVDDDVKKAIENAAKTYEKMGAKINEVSFAALDYALPAYYIVASAEASSNLARFDGIRYGYRTKEYEDIEELYKKTRSEGFGDEVKRRIMLGSFALSSGYYDAYYKKALQVRTLIVNEYNRIFENNHIILSPVTPSIAYKIGEKTTDPLTMYLDDIFTVPANIGGIPALSLPCGESDGMPIGMQLLGPALSEGKLYNLGHKFEMERR